MANILITGGAGFIGINLVKYWLKHYPNDRIVVYDNLSYAANIYEILDMVKKFDNLFLHYGNICEASEVAKVLRKYEIDGVLHLAAESHVDNSIKNPYSFIQNNVLGTGVLLEECRRWWGNDSTNKFVHVSTDEVFGALEEGDPLFDEMNPMRPNSPYSASKASSDCIALAYIHTYGMNISITNCSNNFGPWQHEEKLIPHMIKLALDNKELPIYGTGENIRDWIYVEDHCAALDIVYHNGEPGRYCIGANNELRNNDIVERILCELGKPFGLMTWVEDRKGHDYRYGINPAKAIALGWTQRTDFSDALRKTVNWYKEKWNG